MGSESEAEGTKGSCGGKCPITLEYSLSKKHDKLIAMNVVEQAPLFKIDSLQFKYPKANSPLLDNLDLKVFSGDAVGVTGPSGSGKTTLLKLLSCLETPTFGQILFEGRTLNRLDIKSSLELSQKIGMSFQRGGLLDYFSVSGNIEFALKELTDLNLTQRRALVADALNKVGLFEARNQQLKELSGGMLKRLSLARAMALKPKVLLLDEPTAGLDPVTSTEIVELIKNYKNENLATVLLVSTDLSVLYSMSNKIGILWAGRFIQMGTFNELKQSSDPVVQQYLFGRLEGPLTGKFHA